MAQKREKDETNLELKVPSDPLPSSCPDLSGTSHACTGSDLARIDLGGCPERKAKRKHRSVEFPGAPETSTQAEGAFVEEEEAPAPAKKKAVTRCSGCGKRVGLTGFRCRCGDLFCSEHRYSDRHECSFDYKAAGREAIARENPVVRAPKILKV